MNRARAIAALLFLVGGATWWTLAHKTTKSPTRWTARVLDRRCRGGCSNSIPQGLLWILKTGTTFPYATGSLLGYSNGVQNVTVTDTRASSVYCANGAGTLVQLSSNQPCVEAANANLGTSQGLRVEGSATNSILQSQALATTWVATGAVVAAPTISNNTADVTDPAGGSTASKIVYPSVSGVNAESAATQAWTATATAWSLSVYLRTLSGTATVWVSSGAAAGAPTVRQSCSVTTTWTRCTLANATLTAASWTYELGVDLRDASQTTQGAQTVYAWGAQAEAQAFASSYIPTTTVTVTRAADTISVPTPSFSNANIFAVGATLAALESGSTPPSSPIGLWTIAVGSGVSTNGQTTQLQNNSFLIQSFDNTGTAFNDQYSATQPATPSRYRFARNGTTVSDTIFANGSSVTDSQTGTGTTFASNPANFYIGTSSLTGPGNLNGWITNICADNSTTNCTP